MMDKKKEGCDRAVALLAEAVKGVHKNHAHRKKETDLDPLRDREDFRRLLAGLENADSKPIERK
jgi:hypothetical protein